MATRKLGLMPMRLARGVSAHVIPADAARTLQNVEADWLLGRMRRARGWARMDYAPATNTIESVLVAVRQDGTRVLVSAGNGVVSVAAGVDGAGAAPLWSGTITKEDA